MRLSANGDVEHVDEVSTGSGSAQLRTPKAFANFSPGFIPGKTSAFKYATPKELANSYRVDIRASIFPRVETLGWNWRTPSEFSIRLADPPTTAVWY
jgi:hypothetical protein